MAIRSPGPPDEITVLEVVQALDGVVGEEGKEAGGIWADGVEALRETFRSNTIADIARRESQESGAACTTSRRLRIAMRKTAWTSQKCSG